MMVSLFERFTVAKEPSWKRRALLGASIGVHAVAALGLGVWSLLVVHEIAPPPLALVYYKSPPAAPPPGGSGQEVKKPAVRHLRPATTAEPTQPPTVAPQPVDEQTKAQSSDVEGEGTPDGKGNTPGGSGTDPKGIGTEPGGGNGTHGPPEAKSIAPRTVPAFTLAAQQLTHPLPSLPEWFKQARPNQKVGGTYRVCIDGSGSVSSVDIVSQIGGVDGAIANHIRATWRYRPQPVPVCFSARVEFEIR
jgi:hypothetical protein